MTNAIFVYGLLKPGFSLFHVVEPFVMRSAVATIRGRLYDAGVPAARFDEEGEIEGFILWLDEGRLDEALKVLDELEDEGDVYRRVLIQADTDGGRVEAHAYEYLSPPEETKNVGRAWR